MTDLAGTSAYTHDAAGRVTAATHPAGEGAAESYTYDNAGYRVSDAAHPGPFDIDPDGRLLDDGRFTYSYDADGQLTSKAAKAGGAQTTYEWDQLGRLTAVHLPGGDVLHYAYDPLGRRVRSDGPGGVQTTLWSQGNPLASYDGAGHLTAAYTATGRLDEILEVRRGADRTYPLVDGQGSEIAQADNAGTVTATAAYDTFGSAHALTGTPVLGFLGRPVADASGLLDLRARAADPTTGRFLSEDPQWGTDLYNYAGADPVDATDPTGRDIAETGEVEAEAEIEGEAVEETLANNARVQANTLEEQLSMEELQGNPRIGQMIMEGEIKDPNFPEDVWAKMQAVRNNPNGTKTVIHFWQNLQTGLRMGFKFK
jgi:RHS repeat-associated protein